MEKCGCKDVLGLSELKYVCVNTEALGTDRNFSVMKMMKEDIPTVEHQFDAYQLVKINKKEVVDHILAKRLL